MKAPILLQPAPPRVGKTVMRLTILGGLVLGCVYALLLLCSSAIKILE
ncbi:MAG: hypothetical protein P0Y53_18025 [Candidatus Pseudobacter hemicellulosilyticus]|uniref:Uncharacterized protein n=1 Tax=Candidatus Pseudobacter hemicellulosilyticus TaxID=3121375 RepID=A0AAJ5WPV3_9BACT|nr:MAG: hypothetical protein P0Y53_18025 [Pseudobacter sp.]